MASFKKNQWMGIAAIAFSLSACAPKIEMKPCKAETDEFRVLETKTLEQKVAGYHSPRIDLVQKSYGVRISRSGNGPFSGYRIRLTSYFGPAAALRQIEEAQTVDKEALSAEEISLFLNGISISLNSYRPKIDRVIVASLQSSEQIISMNESNDSESGLQTVSQPQRIIEAAPSNDLADCPRYGAVVTDFTAHFNDIDLSKH